MSMKLYKVKIRGGHNTFGTNYNESYVVAESPDRAYQQVREFLHVRTNSGLIPAFSKAGYSPRLLTNNYIRQQYILTDNA